VAAHPGSQSGRQVAANHAITHSGAQQVVALRVAPTSLTLVVPLYILAPRSHAIDHGAAVEASVSESVGVIVGRRWNLALPCSVRGMALHRSDLSAWLHASPGVLVGWVRWLCSCVGVAGAAPARPICT
jgi:hypothetical protein